MSISNITKLRMGVIGPGIFWNKAHKPNLVSRDDVEIVGFCASSERRKAQIHEEFPAAPFYTDVNLFLNEIDCDVVLIMAPISLAASLVEKALLAGKNVVTEKPLADSSAAAIKLAKLAKEKSLSILVAEQNPYKPVTVAAKKAIADGLIGKVVCFDEAIFFHLDESHVDGYGKGWRKDGNFPLGVLFDGGIHTISSYSAIFGNCESVFASGVSLREGFGEFDHIQAHFQFENNVRGQLTYAGCMADKRNYCYIRGTKGILELSGDTLTLISDNENAETKKLYSPDNTPPHAIMWDKFIHCLKTNTQPDYTAADAAKDVAILEAVDKSCHTHQATQQ